eukprot:TRINITY_DN1147_c0_g2_i3.p1 TRINITY_DN1147_c0_g2~~TRINITY_DN1147_c0_g2_i3.p1  ORF type:complete len:651 (-),score=111.80 TRINITY_DN1147_c0_g2_i3:660-2612(-)
MSYSLGRGLRVFLAIFICVVIQVVCDENANDWGTYRPNLYFGLRTKTSPETVQMGMMWFGGNQLNEIRHDCNMDNKGVHYNWVRHDGRRFGQQEITDQSNGVKLQTTYINPKGLDDQWLAQISGDVSAKKNRATIVIYFSIDNGGQFTHPRRFSKSGLGNSFSLSGSSSAIGDFDLEINKFTESPLEPVQLPEQIGDMFEDGTMEPEKVSYVGMKLPNARKQESWEAQNILKNALSQEMSRRYMYVENQMANSNRVLKMRTMSEVSGIPLELPNRFDARSTFAAFAIHVQGKFQLTIRLRRNTEVEPIPISEIEQLILKSERQFDERFENMFNLSESTHANSHVTVGRAALSNLLGGIGYFHGDYVVRTSNGGVRMEGPAQLLTGVPSRSFFPRGFLWDEGFHQLIMQQWDKDISQEIISSWMSLIDSDGWLPREQILGAEARSKVPKEFQAQKSDIANPPTLQVAIHRLLELYSESKDPSSRQQALEFMERNIDALTRNFQWFLREQSGDLEGSFRWRGRTANHTFASGLDDYPRGQLPHLLERHLDLHCWVTYYAKLMMEMTEALGRDASEYKATYLSLLQKLDEYHWDASQNLYADYIVSPQGQGHYSKHVGYVTLFPLLLGLIPHDSPKLKQTLNVMQNSDQLWSP